MNTQFENEFSILPLKAFLEKMMRLHMGYDTLKIYRKRGNNSTATIVLASSGEA
ncbi:MAG: hypothetical protein ACLFU9_01705 [Candidatus Bathyarchaeia archaeon]